MMKKLVLGIAVCCGGSGVNGVESMPVKSHDEWIENHSTLINEACHDAGAFCNLLDAISSVSESTDEMKSLYESVEFTWDDENIFEAVVIDDAFCSYQRDRF